MTLDEAIKDLETEYKSDFNRQLAEWLKELKAYREIIEQWKHDQISDFYVLRALSEVTE